MEEDEKRGVGTPLEHREKHIAYAKERRRLGFIDIEIDADGNAIPAEEGNGVADSVMDELTTNSTRYHKQVQEQKARKKIDIITPIQGVGRGEYEKGMLRSDEYFKDI